MAKCAAKTFVPSSNQRRWRALFAVIAVGMTLVNGGRFSSGQAPELAADHPFDLLDNVAEDVDDQTPLVDPFGVSTDSLQSDETTQDKAGERDPTGDTELSAAADLTIRTIRDLDPKTPLEILRSIEALLNVGQPTIANTYIEKLIAAGPTDAQLVAVYRKFGPSLFLRMTRERRLSPESTDFARRVIMAARAAATDPERIRDLIKQLQTSDEAVRAAALVGISEAGEAAVGPLLPLLDASRGTNAYAYFRTAMRALGRDAHGPLLGALQSPDVRIQAAAIRALGDLNVQTSLPFICRPAVVGDTPDVQVAGSATLAQLGGLPAGSDRSNAYLAKVANRLLRDGFENPNQRLIRVWSWDTETNEPTDREMPSDVASTYFAAWIAADLHAIDPGNAEYEQLYLTTQLAAAKMTGGLDVSIRESNPEIYQRLRAVPLDRFQVVLLAETGKNEAATLGAAEMIGDLGGTAEFAPPDRVSHSLARALKHGDPRIRFATVSAIVRIDPVEPYLGAADFWHQLRWFASTTGSRRVLIVHASTPEAESIAGMANGQGFVGRAVATHQDAMRAAKSSPDYEAILISDTVELWTELLQQVRRDPLTSRIPVGLIVRGAALEEAEALDRADPLTVAFPLPKDPVTLALALQNTLNQGSNSRVNVETRMVHGEKAIDWLSNFVAHHEVYSYYNILDGEKTLIAALSVPEFAAASAAALGRLGTPDSQRALVDLASTNSQPIELREVAAEAFHIATQRQGVQLTQKQVLIQYDRYNASERLDEATQDLLGSILDSLEAAASRTPIFETTDTP